MSEVRRSRSPWREEIVVLCLMLAGAWGLRGWLRPHRPTAHRPTNDRPTNDRPTNDRPTNDRPTNDRSTADRPTVPAQHRPDAEQHTANARCAGSDTPRPAEGAASVGDGDPEAVPAAERARIVRDLHDVVTHNVAAMIVQAEAARYLTGAPDRLDATLTTVTDTGRRAIADLRHLLHLLTPVPGDPQDPARPAATETPCAGDLHALVEEMRLAGQPVEFAEAGQAEPASRAAEIVAYRVVQAALTDALRHAPGSRTVVEVRHAESGITVQVRTDGAVFHAATGRDLAEVRARVEALGGEFHQERHQDGTFLIRTLIPAGALRDRSDPAGE
ncbi:histidine kinase [Nonomuraea sp. NPDC049421]|uniref:histidine kinase n=1 Tax=Nonomuraea sp. NPDC049421 TaxID=3155275 RepID=UPI00344986DD